MTFGQFIRVKRVAANLTQEQLAHSLGFSHRNAVSRRENGEIAWRVDDLPRLAKVLSTTANKLMKEYDNLKKVHLP